MCSRCLAPRYVDISLANKFSYTGLRMEITHVFFDVGGVLGTNSWDRYNRAEAIRLFGLDNEYKDRHDEVIGDFESGRMTLEEYLHTTVFYKERSFTRAEFVAHIKAQSKPHADTLALARRLADRSAVHLMTLNNESEELNRFRIARFGLHHIFTAFLSSCWLGAVKPSRLIYERALGIAQAPAAQVVFIDDRMQNLDQAQALGMQTIHYTEATALETELQKFGLL